MAVSDVEKISLITFRGQIGSHKSIIASTNSERMNKRNVEKSF